MYQTTEFTKVKTMTLTIFLFSWVFVGVATASLLTYLDWRDGCNVTVGDLILGTLVGIICGYLVVLMLIKGLICNYDPPKFWNEVVWKSHKKDSK